MFRSHLAIKSNLKKSKEGPPQVRTRSSSAAKDVRAAASSAFVLPCPRVARHIIVIIIIISADL